MNCCDHLMSQAAEEITRLLDATESICQRERGEMVRLAGEMNTALDRGLYGVNGELFGRMQGHQQVLTELGRGSAIRAEPVGEKGWRVLRVEVEGLCVFAGADAETEVPAADPSDPPTRASSPEGGAGNGAGDGGGPGG